jgi:hypothetical protein
MATDSFFWLWANGMYIDDPSAQASIEKEAISLGCLPARVQWIKTIVFRKGLRLMNLCCQNARFDLVAMHSYRILAVAIIFGMYQHSAISQAHFVERGPESDSQDFVNPRTAFTAAVRSRTRRALARIKVSASCCSTV